MITPRLFLALSMLLLTVRSPAFAADVTTGRFDCSIVSGEPQVTPDASFVTPGQDGGMRVYWIEGQGRRDLGQQFQVDHAFEARQLAVKINSGTDGFDAKAPFKLTFAQADASRAQPGKILAEFEGVVTGGDQPSSGKWLVFSFPAVEFAPGHYVFLLQYAEPGPAGRSMVLQVSTSAGAYPGGKGIMSDSADPAKLNFGLPIHFILSSSARVMGDSASLERRTLRVDQRGGADYTSLAAAAADCRPGDTISLVPGSGPYREPLEITASGRVDAPIVVEGNGELVTGFEPLTAFRRDGEAYVCDIPVEYPYVLTYRGERLRQDAVTGQFTDYAVLSADRQSISLLPGVSPEGWEVSSRVYVVKIWNVSHHVYRNLRASGAQNDAFNLHGTGKNLVFENIEGFHCLDEGFSAHDDIRCEIRKGSFHGNDNGIVNIARSFMEASDIEIFDNLGWGLYLLECEAVLDHVTVRDNGLAQILLADSSVTWTNITAAKPAWDTRQWITYKESAGKDIITKPLVADSKTKLVGGLPSLLGAM